MSIGTDGMVRAQGADGTAPIDLGQIRLVRVADPAGIVRLDGGLYQLADDAPPDEQAPGEDGAGQLVQGAVERSNVQLTEEMVRMMLIQRAYAANAQIVQAADQLMGIANTLRR
nr:flagellar hook-basal body complex protein [Sphingomonas sp. CFBP 13720]